MNLIKHLNRSVLATALTAAFLPLLPAVAHAQGTVTFNVLSATDLPGSDYRAFWNPSDLWQTCQEACRADGNCRAFTYVRSGRQGPQSVCWLKYAVPRAVPNIPVGGRAADAWSLSGIKYVTASPAVPAQVAPVAPVAPVAAATSAQYLAGSWQFHSCNDKYGLLIGFRATGATTFDGGFENGYGLIKNGHVGGNQISFTREYGSVVQQFSGTLVNDGGRLKIVNGVWRGPETVCPHAMNWRAEKR